MGDSKKLSARILIGMALGIIVGVILNNFIGTPFVKDVIVGIIFNFGSTVFTNAIQMLVVPLVLFSLVVGTCDMGDVTKMGRIGIKTHLSGHRLRHQAGRRLQPGRLLRGYRQLHTR